MFIQTEATPNPATLKFLPGHAVMDEGTFEARDLDQAERSPLAKALMQLPGVTGVFFANDFISVTKGEGEWQHLKPAVLGVVCERDPLQRWDVRARSEPRPYRPWQEERYGRSRTLGRRSSKHSQSLRDDSRSASQQSSGRTPAIGPPLALLIAHATKAKYGKAQKAKCPSTLK